MKNLRKYGKAPFSIAVIHGGPGARGEMKPVALELSKTRGILEPLQTATSINGQIKELKNILNKHAKLPVILIGHSWGAWFSFIFTARYPKLVKKLILISSGTFEEKYVSQIMKTRLSRLGHKERNELNTYIKLMNKQKVSELTLKRLTKKIGDNLVFVKFGELMSKTDSFKPIILKNKVDFQLDIMQGVWKQAESLRKSGKLLGLAKQIQCPVIAIHGDYDPHPSEGVRKPLSRSIKNFRFIILENCGHTPWIERQARDKIFRILKSEI